MQHGRLRTVRCPWSIRDKLFELLFNNISDIFIAGTPIPAQHPASARSERMSDGVRGDWSRGPAETENPNKSDNEGVR